MRQLSATDRRSPPATDQNTPRPQAKLFLAPEPVANAVPATISGENFLPARTGEIKRLSKAINCSARLARVCLGIHVHHRFSQTGEAPIALLLLLEGLLQ